MRGALLGVLLVAVVVGITLWWRMARDPQPPASPAGHRTAALNQTPMPSRVPVLGNSTLRLRILGPDGKPARGRLYWEHATGRLAPSMLTPEQGYPLGPGVRQQEHHGAAEILVPAGASTWLRATGDGPMLLAAYACVPPLEHDQDREIHLSNTRRTLHAFVLEASLGRAAPGKEVTLWQVAPQQPTVRKVVATARTDALGYARFADLEPDGYQAVVEGAGLEDPPPHCVRVLLLPSMPVPEMACMLVLPEPRRRVRLDVHADLGDVAKNDLGPVKLFFERVTGREGELYPVPETVRFGAAMMEADLPLGDYRLGVLPLGALAPVGGDERYVVTAGSDPLSVSVRLRPATLDTEVTLSGLGSGDLPVTVYPRPVGRPLMDDSGLLYVGPYRWHLPTQRVGPIQDPVRLVVRGRHAAWIASVPADLRGGRVEVGLVPATVLALRHFGAAPSSGPVVVDVQSSSDRETVVLTPKLVQHEGAMHPAFAASVVVPQGVARITCWDTSAGKVLWTREAEAHGLEVVATGG